VLPQLIAAFDEREPSLGSYLARVVANVGEPAIAPLRQALTHPRPDVRGGAAETLALIVPTPVNAIPDLLKLLSDDDIRVREAASGALAAIAADDPSSVIAALGDQNVAVRLGAASALKQMKSVPPRAAPILSTLLAGDASPEVRAASASALGKIGPEAATELPRLREALKSDPNVEVRVAAAETLGGLRQLALPALPELVAALEDRTRTRGDRVERHTFTAAARALEMIGWEAHVALPDLARHGTLSSGFGEDERARAVVKTIAQDLEARRSTIPESALEQAIRDLDTARATLGDRTPLEATLARAALQDELDKRPLAKAREVVAWLVTYPPLAAGLGYALLGSVLVFGALWLRPLWLLKVNDLVKSVSEVSLPWLGGVKLPLNKVLLVGFFAYHPRVLDAWVRAHVQTARRTFDRNPRAQARRVTWTFRSGSTASSRRSCRADRSCARRSATA